MIKTCMRCPAHSWGGHYPSEAVCRLRYKPQGYLRPEDCLKKPKSDAEVAKLARISS